MARFRMTDWIHTVLDFIACLKEEYENMKQNKCYSLLRVWKAVFFFFLALLEKQGRASGSRSNSEV